MSKNISFRLFFFFFLLISLTFDAYSMSTKKIASILKNSTVYVEILDEEEEIYSRGTGIVINKKDGKYYILTNAHVVTEEWDSNDEPTYLPEEFYITVWPSKSLVNGEYHPGYYIIDYMVWSSLDLAILILDYNNPDGGIFNIDNPKEEDYVDFVPIKLSNSFDLTELDTIYTAGYPHVLGSGFSDINTPDIFITKAEINSFVTTEEGWRETDYYSIVFRGGVKSGASGGPLVNSRAELVGVNGLGESHYSVQEKSFGSEEIIPEHAVYDFALDINDFILLALLDDKYNNNPESIFFGYLPKIKKGHQNQLINSWNEGSWFLPGLGYKTDLQE